jgi:outer membrane protein assembly factor BamB
MTLKINGNTVYTGQSNNPLVIATKDYIIIRTDIDDGNLSRVYIINNEGKTLKTINDVVGWYGKKPNLLNDDSDLAIKDNYLYYIKQKDKNMLSLNYISLFDSLFTEKEIEEFK